MRLSRSRITSAHSSFHSLRAKRSSSSLRNSSARNEHNTCPRIVSSHFLLDFVLVNGELLASPSQVFAIPFVTHQRLVSLAQRVAQRGHHGFAIVAVLRGLILVHAHHIPARTLDPDF